MKSAQSRDTLLPVRWMLVLLVGVVIVVGNMFPLNQNVNLITFGLMFLFALVHGTRQYGVLNLGLWFAVTFVVSTFFEGLSIHTGFPFGHYHYTIGGPRIWEVPLMIPVIYFGLSYTAWNVAKVLLGVQSRNLSGGDKFLLPLTAAVVMTLWDLVTDPQASTLSGAWIWENGGNYFGVPISNFFGWVFVVYVFMQIYAIWISRGSVTSVASRTDDTVLFALEPVVVYLCLGTGIMVAGFSNPVDTQIHTSMAMVSFFTMVVVAGLAIRNLLKRRSTLQA